MEVKHVIETILFVSSKPLTARDILRILKTTAEQNPDHELAANLAKFSEKEIETQIQQLAAEYEGRGQGFKPVCVAGAWQFATLPEFAPWLRTTLGGAKPRPPRLTQAALETLAIIAYRQPITRAEIEQIRGVNVDAVMQTLLERGLIEVVGRAEAPGKPPLYGTTEEFLQYFGLRSLDDLPGAQHLRKPAQQISQITTASSQSHTEKEPAPPMTEFNKTVQPHNTNTDSLPNEPLAANANEPIENPAPNNPSQPDEKVSSS